MKILIDARFYGLENAGIGRYVNNLIKHLKVIDTKNYYTVLVRKKHFNELKLPGNWKKVIAKSRHYTIKEQIEVLKLINKYQPDIVHIPHFNVPLLYKGKLVTTIHDLLWHIQKGKNATTLNPILYFIKYLGYKIVFSKAINSSTRILTPSSYVKKQINKHYDVDSKKITITHEGVEIPNSVTDLNTIKKRYEINSPFFIYTGSAYPHKNLEIVLDSVKEINEKHNVDVQLFIASSRNVFLHDLEKYASQIRAKKYIRSLGFVPDKDLFGLYSLSKAFVFPSKSEGFGLPALEALASGTIAAVSNIPVFKEIYQDKVIYFDPNDQDSITINLLKVINLGPGKRLEMLKEGREYSQKYSWETMARKTLKVYESSNRL